MAGRAWRDAIDPLDPASWPSHCPECGIEFTKPRQCTGHSRRTKKHCGKTTLTGMRVCLEHGGRAGRSKQAATRRLEEQAARRAAATYGLPISIEPHRALEEELHRTAGHVAWLGELIGSLDHQDSAHPAVIGDDDDEYDEGDETPGSGRSGLKQYSRDKGVLWEKPAVWVELYRDERKHLADVAAACIKAGVDERRVQLAEQQGQLLAKVLAGVLGDLGIDPQTEAARAVVTRHLHAVRGAA